MTSHQNIQILPAYSGLHQVSGQIAIAAAENAAAAGSAAAAENADTADTIAPSANTAAETRADIPHRLCPHQRPYNLTISRQRRYPG